MRIWGVPGEGAPRRQCRPPATHSGGWPGQDLGSGPGSHGQHCAVARVRGRVGTPGLGGGEGCEHWKWTCRSARRGQSHFGTPKPIFFTVTSVPAALLQAGGCPGSRLVPLVSRRSQCIAGLEMCSTQGAIKPFQRPPRHQVHAEDVSVGLSSPSQADFPCSCDNSHLMSSG